MCPENSINSTSQWNVNIKGRFKILMVLCYACITLCGIHWKLSGNLLHIAGLRSSPEAMSDSPEWILPEARGSDGPPLNCLTLLRCWFSADSGWGLCLWHSARWWAGSRILRNYTFSIPHALSSWLMWLLSWGGLERKKGTTLLPVSDWVQKIFCQP